MVQLIQQLEFSQLLQKVLYFSDDRTFPLTYVSFDTISFFQCLMLTLSAQTS